MPIRQTPLVTGEYYHIFNRGINRQPTFIVSRDFERALETLHYYRYSSPPIRFSHYMGKPAGDRVKLSRQFIQLPLHAIVIAYCLMPNHFHLVVKQERDNGLARYLANFQNSYTKFFNAKHKRSGALFDRQFKAVRIESEAQLLHVTRYVHLNPYSSHLITFEDIPTYPYSSLPEYLAGRYHLSDPQSVIDIYPDRYRRFVLDHADYQQHLESLKHLTLEIPGEA